MLYRQRSNRLRPLRLAGIAQRLLVDTPFERRHATARRPWEKDPTQPGSNFSGASLIIFIT
jgi:hypothetical protein